MVSRTPDTGARQPHPSLKVQTPHKGVRSSLVPVGTQNRWGPKDLTKRTRASRTRSPGSGPSKSQSTTSAKSYTRRRPSILRRISLSMRYLLRPGNCATIFRHTELSYPLRAILHNSNATGNIAKWAAELAEFQLDFQPRHAIKSQILADFIAEWTHSPS